MEYTTAVYSRESVIELYPMFREKKQEHEWLISFYNVLSKLPNYIFDVRNGVPTMIDDICVEAQELIAEFSNKFKEKMLIKLGEISDKVYDGFYVSDDHMYSYEAADQKLLFSKEHMLDLLEEEIKNHCPYEQYFMEDIFYNKKVQYAYICHMGVDFSLAKRMNEIRFDHSDWKEIASLSHVARLFVPHDEEYSSSFFHLTYDHSRGNCLTTPLAENYHSYFLFAWSFKTKDDLLNFKLYGKPALTV